MRCAILGASGHGRVVAEIAELNGYQNICFFDDRWPSLQYVNDWPVVGDTGSLVSKAKEYDLTVIAIGNNQVRVNKQELLILAGARFSVLAHPSAVVSKYASVNIGTVIMAKAVVNPFCSIDSACIINTAATIDHDCVLSKGVHISPGVNLAGGVEVGEYSWVGIGCQVKQLVSIGCNVTVGAGATVIKNVTNNQTVVGNPAQEIIKSKN